MSEEIVNPQERALELLRELWGAVAEGDMQREHRHEQEELLTLITAYMPSSIEVE